MAHSICNKIRILRSCQKMTQERLAEYPDVSIQQLHKYEAGKNRSAVEKLVRLADSFGSLIFRGIRIRIALIIRVRDIVRRTS